MASLATTGAGGAAGAFCSAWHLLEAVVQEHSAAMVVQEELVQLLALPSGAWRLLLLSLLQPQHLHASSAPHLLCLQLLPSPALGSMELVEDSSLVEPWERMLPSSQWHPLRM